MLNLRVRGVRGSTAESDADEALTRHVCVYWPSIDTLTHKYRRVSNRSSFYYLIHSCFSLLAICQQDVGAETFRLQAKGQLIEAW